MKILGRRLGHMCKAAIGCVTHRDDFATEFLAIGLLAGVLATAGATLAGYLLATRVYELEYSFNLSLTLMGPVLGMLFVGAAGVLATRDVVSTPPVNVLRAH